MSGNPPAPGIAENDIVNRFIVPLGLFVALIVVSIWLIGLGGDERPRRTVELGELADPGEVYDPVRAGETLPRGYRQLLRRDAILPVYDPEFVDASATQWPGDTLVLGVAIDDDARAYPISHLNRREMVIDRVAGIPILVTW